MAAREGEGERTQKDEAWVHVRPERPRACTENSALLEKHFGILVRRDLRL